MAPPGGVVAGVAGPEMSPALLAALERERVREEKKVVAAAKRAATAAGRRRRRALKRQRPKRVSLRRLELQAFPLSATLLQEGALARRCSLVLHSVEAWPAVLSAHSVLRCPEPGGQVPAREAAPSEVVELQDRFIHRAVELPAVAQLLTLLVPLLKLLLTACSPEGTVPLHRVPELLEVCLLVRRMQDLPGLLEVRLSARWLPGSALLEVHPTLTHSIRIRLAQVAWARLLLHLVRMGMLTPVGCMAPESASEALSGHPTLVSGLLEAWVRFLRWETTL